MIDQPVDLHDRAVDLRRQGFSYSQIGRRLGVHKSVIARWVAAVPFAGFNDESLAEQLSALRDPQVYNRALELRQSGWSYKMIEAELGVARSTLSGWFRDEIDHNIIVVQGRRTGQIKSMQTSKKRHEKRVAEVHRAAVDEIHGLLANGLSDRELLLSGIMLYWAEGAKTTLLSVSNSDPAIIRMYVLWLEHCLHVSRDRLRAAVHLYPDVDVDEAECYWASIIGILRSQFYAAQVDTRIDKSVQKYGKLPYGTVHVRVSGQGTADLHRRILGWIAGYQEFLVGRAGVAQLAERDSSKV
jgi:hypothetical protein